MNRANLIKRLMLPLWAVPLGWFLINADFSVIPARFAQWLGEPTLFVYPGQALAIFLVFMAAFEYLRMLSLPFPRNGFWLVYLWLGFQTVSYFIPSIALRPSLENFLLLMIVASEAAFWGKATGRWKRASLLFSGTMFLSIANISLLNLYREPFQTVFPRLYAHPMLSQMGVITVCAAVFLCDTGAYFAGNLWGKHHFSSISPRKTIEGSIGGFISAVVVSVLGWHYFSSNAYPNYLGVIMGVLIGVFAQAGDLLVSLIKRYFRVKDASHIIPGHGGILDRFDSIFFTIPVLNLFFVILQRLS